MAWALLLTLGLLTLFFVVICVTATMTRAGMVLTIGIIVWLVVLALWVWSTPPIWGVA